MKPFQRDVDVGATNAAARAELRTRLRELEGQLARTPDDVRVRGQLGEALRMLGDLEAATAHLEAAVGGAREARETGLLISNLIRLGTTLQYRGEHDRAVSHLVEAIEVASSTADLTLLDYALQHLGKCRVEQGDLIDARACFERALELRNRRGDVGLIDSTRRAIAALDALERSE